MTFSDWPLKRLGELGDDRAISYGVVQPGSGITNGIPIIRVNNIVDGRWNEEDLLRISPAIEADYKRTRLRGGEVLLTLVGSVGHSAIATEEMLNWNVARAVAVISVKSDLSPRWVHWCLQSPDAQRQMNLKVTTTVQATLNLRDVADILIPLPPVNYRTKVERLLGALDDKIAVNERAVAAADELRALSLRRFMTSNPEATEKLPLSSLAQFVNGKAFTRDASGTGRMVIRIAELNSEPGSSTIYNDIKVPPQHLATQGDVLFAWSGSLRVSRWYRSEAIVNQHIFKVVPGIGMPSWLIFELIRFQLPRFRAIAEGKATTMGHIQRHHLNVEVTVPTRQYWARLDAELGLLWGLALRAEQERLTLAELRDTLLPRLVSGKLRIKDAEKVAEGAV